MDLSTQLERVHYWQGQLLASADLETQMRVVAELRRQHNRAVHRADGIAIGLVAGEIADGVLPLSCGLAYDCTGRELLVSAARSVSLPSPSITTPHVLVIAFNTATGDSMLTWQPQGAPTSNDGVAVARIIPGAGPDPVRDIDFRPLIARPMARPRLASGQTVPGDTPWYPWNEAGVSLGVQTVIDTSAAGFTTTPNYFAETVADHPSAEFVPVWFASIADPAPGSFTFRLFLRRITREAFDILDSKTQVAKTPAVGGKVSLTSGNVLAKYDSVSRLLPIAARASNIVALSNNIATLDVPLDPFAAAKQVGFGNPPRLAAVTKTPDPAVGFQVTVTPSVDFQVGSVVAKLGSSFAAARPTTVSSIDDLGALELANAISGLIPGDPLGVAQTPSPVTAATTTATTTTVTVQNPENFSLYDIVVCVDDPVENLPPAKITNVAGKTNEILTLDASLPALNGKRIAAVRGGGTVQTVAPEGGEVKVHVDSAKLFHTGDLVAKILNGGVFSEPVRVQSVQSNSKILTLSGTISGLMVGDRIGAADFRVRATVLNVTADGATVTVANATLFPVNSFVVRLDDTYTPAAYTTVSTSSGSSLGLNAALANLKPGDIIALCAFPVTVTVQSIDLDGIVEVAPPGAIQSGDIVAAIPTHPGIAVVTAASAGSLDLATPIGGLAAGDQLSVVTISGTVSVTPGATGKKVVLDPNNRLRVGDFLADIAGWREPGPARSTAWVLDATGTDLTLSSQLDGLMVDDTVGLSSLIAGSDLWFQLRLGKIPADLTPGDEALLVALDRMQGKTKSMFANVQVILPALNLVYLQVEAPAGESVIRPEDLTASILFVRGSPLALVRNQNLYVSWLACQNPDPMPRACTDDTPSDDPCQETVES